MFANLKNKLIEEVKASPSKLQQFANAAQAAVSSSTSTTSGGSELNATNENFFSITEEDTPHNSPLKPLKLSLASLRGGRVSTPQGTSSEHGIRTRKLSNSSMASDASFRLPTYDSPAVYHLQSDADFSGSEMDDSASTANLDVVSKEKLFVAYRKALDRYTKCRGRYTDLAKKYKDLERDSTKARSVLVETQEKAIRRISELREQCTLEQQAKAHLEEALRVEMDDMNCKMQAYQMKLKLLGENPDFDATALEANTALIDLGNETVTAETNNISAVERIAELEHQLKVVTENLEKSTSTIKTLREQEEENALLLAQTKQAIHSELENKEREVKNLTATIKQLQSDLQAAAAKDKRLTEQTEEIKQLQLKLKQSQADKQEADAKVISTEHAITELKKQFAGTEKTLAALEAQHAAISKDNEQKQQDLRQQNSQLNEMVQRYQQKEVSLAEIDNELNRTKNENDILRQTLAAHERMIGELKTLVDTQKQSFEELQRERLSEHELSIKDLQEQLHEAQAAAANEAQRAKQLSAQLQILSEQNESNLSETTEALRSELQKANEVLEQQLSEAREQLANKTKELKSVSNKLTKQKKQYETQQHKITEQAEEIAKLEGEFTGHEAHLQELQIAAQARETQAEAEKQELKTELSSILQEIKVMEERLRVLQNAHNILELEKHDLEARIANMQADSHADAQHVAANAERLKQLELKLQNVESENSQLAERNCLLEESSHRLKKLLDDRERQQETDESTYIEMRLKLETAEDAIQKLNEKMSQVLDENSRMQNAQELMDHDYRTLQDKYDALEKEKLLTEDTITCLRADLERLKNGSAEEASKIQQLNQELKETRDQLRVANEQIHTLTSDLAALISEKAALEKQTEELTNQLSALKAIQCDDDRMAKSLEAKQCRIAELEQNEQSTLQVIDQLNELGAQLERTEEMHNRELRDLRAENQTLHQQSEQLNAEVISLSEQLKDKIVACQEIDASLKDVKQALESSERQLTDLNTKEITVNDLQQRSQERVQALEAELAIANGDVARLHESNDAVQVELDKLKTRHQLRLDELENKLRQTSTENDSLKKQITLQSEGLARIANYDDLQLENEYLNKHVKQLESSLAAEKASSQNNLQETQEHKEKYKSIQCELYVLKESAEEHSKQLQNKASEVEQYKHELAEMKSKLEHDRTELNRQTAHGEFLNEQNDKIEKELLHVQLLIADKEELLTNTKRELKALAESAAAKDTEMEALKQEISQHKLHLESNKILEAEVDSLRVAVESKATLEKELEALKVALEDRNENVQHVSQTEAVKSSQNDAEQLRKINEALQRELEDLKYKSSAEVTNLQQEIEDLQTHNQLMTERLKLVEQNQVAVAEDEMMNGDKELEKAELEGRLKAIMSEVQDVSNRNIFLEQKCENYLIIEQSNERLKLQNAKLSRQLDETLISMQHNEGITANTEFEYLKNIMFQYLTGSSNANNETLVKVISAVLKFTPQQTLVALEKESQKRSLINKIL